MVLDASLIINDIIMIPLLLFNLNVLASFLILSDNLLFSIQPHEASTAVNVFPVFTFNELKSTMKPGLKHSQVFLTPVFKNSFFVKSL